MVLPGPLALARRLLGSASFRIGALTSLGLLGAWAAQTSGAVQDPELHKFSEVRARPPARTPPSGQVGAGGVFLAWSGCADLRRHAKDPELHAFSEVHVQTGQVVLRLRVTHSWGEAGRRRSHHAGLPAQCSKDAARTGN